MNRIRKLLQYGVGAAIAAFALTATAAPDKLLTLTAVSPDVIPAATTALGDPCSNLGALTQVTLTLKNESPRGGNSNINSAAATLLTSASGVRLCAPSSPIATTVVVDPLNPLRIKVSNMTGVRPSNTFTISVYVYVPPTTTCSTATWDADAWVGNSFNGDPFNPLPGVNPPTDRKSIALGCDTVLACGESYNGEPITDSNSTTITRKDDKDPASPCPDVAVNVVITQAGRTVMIQWDEQTYPNLVLETDTMWPIEAVDDPLTTSVTETFPKRTKVAWCPATNPGCTPVFIEAQLCTKSDSPTTADNLATMPALPSGLPPPYDTQVPQRARACIISEAYEVKTFNDCSTAGVSSPCVIVNTIMYVVGDPWLSRQ